MAVNRLNICIEVPAIPGMDRASLTQFPDMLGYVMSLIEQGKDDTEGKIANASFKVGYEWSVEPELVVRTPDQEFIERHGSSRE